MSLTFGIGWGGRPTSGSTAQSSDRHRRLPWSGFTSPTGGTSNSAFPGGAPSLPSLAAEDVADLGAKRAAASRRLREALARGEAARGRTDAAHRLTLETLKREFNKARGQAVSEFAAHQVARQPRFTGKAMRGFAQDQAFEVGRAGFEKAEQLAAIEDLLNTERRTAEDSFALIDAEETRRRADLSRLLRAIGA